MQKVDTKLAPVEKKVDDLSSNVATMLAAMKESQDSFQANFKSLSECIQEQVQQDLLTPAHPCDSVPGG